MKDHGLDLAVIGPNLQGDHGVRVLPGKLHHGAFHRDELAAADRPRVMRGERDGTGDQRKSDNDRRE